MNDMNPYETPTAPLPGTTESRPIATMGRRLVNLLVDYLGIYALAFVIGVLVYAFNIAWVVEDVNEYLFGALVCLAYYTPLEALTGRTLGKLVSGTRVVDTHGEPIGWIKAFKRSLVRLVPFEAFTFLTKERPRGWHDAWTGTQVISLRESAADVAPDNAATTD